MLSLHHSALIAVASIFASLVLHGAPVREGHVEAELVVETESIQPGTPFTVGLRLKMDAHWHTYWRNPGDSGQGTSITWKLPAGFTAGEIQWPRPIRIPTPPFMTYGYEGEVMLLTEITPPATLAPNTTVNLAARGDWLVCSDVCIPGGAELSVAVGVAPETPRIDARRSELFAQTRLQLPTHGSADWPATFAVSGEDITFDIALPAGTTLDTSDVYFFAYSDVIVDAAKPQVASVRDGRLHLRMKKSQYATETPATIAGVLTAKNGFPPALTNRPVEIEAKRGAASATLSTAAPATLIGTILSAFLGGLILNLMPCVFPVLGVKILGFVHQAGADRRKVTLHGLVFTAGVLISFWILAGALIALRAGGEQFGWGFQLQSPGFVFVLAMVLLVFSLSMSGVFEFGLAATAVGGSLHMRQGFSGSFFTGVLATVVATPCAAPFLAGALGAALALPAAQSLVLFTVIAIGLSTPYLLLSAFPQLIKSLPRPGAWMDTFKQGLAFLLYASVAFLVWVLAGQVAEETLLLVLGGLLLAAFASWTYGRFTQQGTGVGRRRFGYALTAFALLAGVAVGFPRTTADAWRDWRPGLAEELTAEGKIVFVDFTARWCATCKVNKFLVFTATDEVTQAFAEQGVVQLKADWTNHDEDITRALASFGRSAVPFNVIYAPGRNEPIILPEVLTPGRVIEALAQATATAP